MKIQKDIISITEIDNPGITHIERRGDRIEAHIGYGSGTHFWTPEETRALRDALTAILSEAVTVEEAEAPAEPGPRRWPTILDVPDEVRRVRGGQGNFLTRVNKPGEGTNRWRENNDHFPFLAEVFHRAGEVTEVEPRVWADLDDVPADVTIRDDDGDEWGPTSDGKRAWTHGPSGFSVGQEVSTSALYAFGPFTEVFR